jgi:hypothetical protein
MADYPIGTPLSPVEFPASAADASKSPRGAQARSFC